MALATDDLQTDPTAALPVLLDPTDHVIKHHAAVEVARAPALYRVLKRESERTTFKGARLRDGRDRDWMALQLIMLTAVRKDAVISGSLEEVDTNRGVWEVSEDRQTKRKRTARIPLSPQAAMLTTALGASTQGVHNRWWSVREYFSLPGHKPITIHGLRATFRMWCQTNQVQYELAEESLGHTVASEVGRAYERDDLLEQRRDVLTRYAEFLESAHPEHDDLAPGSIEPRTSMSSETKRMLADRIDNESP